MIKGAYDRTNKQQQEQQHMHACDLAAALKYWPWGHRAIFSSRIMHSVIIVIYYDNWRYQSSYEERKRKYLGFTDPAKWVGGEANLLLMNTFVPPITQQKVELAVVMEWLFLSFCHIHYERPIQPCRPLHAEVPVVKVCSCLHGNKTASFNLSTGDLT
jgi:hypothetical protein